jgi:hypothetical protein
MRFLIYPAAALAVGFVSNSAQAAPLRHSGKLGLGAGSGGWAAGPYWQGEPTDRRAIWRYGHLQGNDPDQFIRYQLMRDPTNDAHR